MHEGSLVSRSDACSVNVKATDSSGATVAGTGIGEGVGSAMGHAAVTPSLIEDGLHDVVPLFTMTMLTS